MEITGHYMAVNDRYLKDIDYDEKFLLGVKVEKEIKEVLEGILGNENLEVYDRWQPSKNMGFVSKFNSNHYDNIYDFTTVGPLNFILIPDKQNNLYVVVDRVFVNYEVYVNTLYYGEKDYNNVKLAGNLLLETFNKIEVLDYNLFTDIGNILVTVPWEILPAGYLDEETKAGDEKQTINKEKSTEYIRHLMSKNPVMIVKGKENFANYLVFKFKNSDSTILEPETYGNATYVINGDWEDVTKLSKMEIKQDGHGFPIIHDDFSLWEKKISEYI